MQTLASKSAVTTESTILNNLQCSSDMYINLNWRSITQNILNIYICQKSTYICHTILIHPKLSNNIVTGISGAAKHKIIYEIVI